MENQMERKSYEKLNQTLEENKINNYLMKFRRMYYSKKLLTFKEWLKMWNELDDLLD